MQHFILPYPISVQIKKTAILTEILLFGKSIVIAHMYTIQYIMCVYLHTHVYPSLTVNLNLALL